MTDEVDDRKSISTSDLIAMLSSVEVLYELYERLLHFSTIKIHTVFKNMHDRSRTMSVRRAMYRS